MYGLKQHIITHSLLASKLLLFSLSSGLSSARSSGSAEGSDTLAQDTLHITQTTTSANTHLLGRGPLLPSAAILAARRLASSASWSSASDSYA